MEASGYTGQNRRQTRYDHSVSLGNVLTILIMMGSLLVFWGSISERLARLDTKVDLMWSAFSKQLTEK